MSTSTTNVGQDSRGRGRTGHSDMDRQLREHYSMLAAQPLPKELEMLAASLRCARA